MIRIQEPTVQWLWVDKTTGICFPETMAATEGYAQSQAQRILGKRRMAYGEVKPMQVTFTPLSAEAEATERAAYGAWSQRKADEELARQQRLATPPAAQAKDGQ